MRVEIINLVQLLKQNDPSLKILNLSRKNLETDESIAIIEALEKNTVVIELKYLDNNSSGEVAKILGRMLEANHSIKNLYLGSNELTNADLTYIMQGMQKNDSVILIDLNSNLFDVSTPIAKMLAHNTILKEIELTNNCLSEAGCMEIYEGLKSNPNSSLTEFCLYYPVLDCLHLFTDLCSKNNSKKNQTQSSPTFFKVIPTVSNSFNEDKPNTFTY